MRRTGCCASQKSFCESVPAKNFAAAADTTIAVAVAAAGTTSPVGRDT